MLLICIWIGYSDCQDMDKDDAVCPEIVELTVELLNSDTLKWLLLTVQQTNIRLRVWHILRKCSLVELTICKSWLTIYFRQQTKEALRKYIMWVSFPEHNIVVTPLLYLHRSGSGTRPHVLGIKIIHFLLFIAGSTAMGHEVWIRNPTHIFSVTTFTPSSIANITHSDPLQCLRMWVCISLSIVDFAYLGFLWCLS